jgi:signal transduction histidine kinase
MGIRIVELVVGICILLFLGNYAAIHLIHQWVGMIESILFFLLLGFIYKTRKNILVNFLIAGTFLLYAGQVLSLVAINFLDLGIRGNLFFEFGALFQILVFSVGLIYNHRIALQEKVETQEQLIQKLKEIDKIQGKMTLELERKVAERTEQLARKNRQEKAQRELIHKQLERYKLVSQKMSELNLLKDKFFSILSHDLRTPLNSIQGMLNLLKAKAISAQETEELVSELSEKTEATQDLVDNLLQWAILQKDGYQVHLTEFEIKPLVDKIFTLFSNFAKQKKVHLFNLIPEKMILHADENMLKLVIRNLVANAIKFSLKEGSVTVSVEQNLAEKQLIFHIKDNGVGISAENIYKLFDAKSHYSTQGTQQERGTGLGLLLCKEFIEKNKGKIWVESALNEGSTFSFSLPIILPPTP